jgi:hypothetical protein
VAAITARANQYFSTIRAAVVVAFAPPAVLELGNATGFDFELVDRSNVGHEVLMQARGQLLQAAGKYPAIGMLRPNGLADEPQYQLELDWERSALGPDRRHQQHAGRRLGVLQTSSPIAAASRSVHPAMHSACCRRILTAGMCATAQR